MNRLTLLILLVAAVQVYCGPCKSLLVIAYNYLYLTLSASKRSWDALEPLEDDSK